MTKRRAGRAYQDFKAKVRAHHASAQAPCVLCGQAINYALAYPHPRCWSLDHRIALHAGGPEFNPANTQPSHLRCNLSRGGTEGNRQRPTHTSVRW